LNTAMGNLVTRCERLMSMSCCGRIIMIG
jgi:hypothetical protein